MSEATLKTLYELEHRIFSALESETRRVMDPEAVILAFFGSPRRPENAGEPSHNNNRKRSAAA